MVIHSDVPAVGEFECSNDLINCIHMAIRWGIRMYLRSAPLDPDRTERMPWLGDPAKDSESQAFNFNVAPFYAKWIDDIRRSQRNTGAIPHVSMFWGPGSNVLWPSVFTIIPDWFVDFYGDSKVETTNYEAMKRWMAAMQKYEVEENGTVKGGAYGDWCDALSLETKLAVEGGGNTSRALISTAYHYNNYRIMARVAQRLNKPEDVKFFTEHADRLRDIFNKTFFDPATNNYLGGTQCANLLPLTFGLVPEGHKQQVIANLVDDIMVKRNGHLSVGLIGVQWLMQTLTECGRPDVAWTIANQTTRPSWGYMISKGATTIWERWDTDTQGPGMNSEALLMQAGNLDAWLYQTLAGINYDRQQPGFKHIILRPHPVGDLTWVKAHLDSSYGRIASHWEQKGKQFIWNVTVPANTTATVYVPARSAETVTESGKPASKAEGVRFVRMEKDRAVFEVGSGKYRFESK
ncbi:MAG: alpha-L-rhamnosidase C-terminal domain-containing protein [bacterium]